MSCPHEQSCSECGDKMIHQNNRGADESASGFGQWVHDKLPNEFWYMDIDGVSYKLWTNTLRIIEHKNLNGSLSDGQNAIFPKIADALELSVQERKLSSESGMFVVRSDLPPRDFVHVERITSRTRRGWESTMNVEQLKRFIEGESLGKSLAA